MQVRRSTPLTAGISATVGLALVVAAMVVPLVWHRDVHVDWPPLHADWVPRFEPRLVITIAIGLGLWSGLPIVASRLSWFATVVLSTAASWVWALALALSDGRLGLSRVYERPGEYLYDVVRVDDIGIAVATYTDRIAYAHPEHWRIHVSGHPPGSLISFVLLDRIGISDPFWVSVTVVTLGATAVAAVLMTLDLLGSRALARRAAPWVALAPLAVWAGHGETLYAAVAAWGVFLLAVACTRGTRRAWTSRCLAVVAGLVLGWSLFLSYGLVLFGLLPLAVFTLTRTWRLLPWAALGVAVVVAAFWTAGYTWWEAYPVLRERYYEGIGGERPYEYWVWADLAAWTFTVGLVTWAAFPRTWTAARQRVPLAVLATAALAGIVVASLTGLSKAEVERIWLPFTLWIVPMAAFIQDRWRRPLLLSQVVLAILLQTLLLTRW
jgi:methylthioxylose transferase